MNRQAAGRGIRSLSLLLSGESPEFTPPAGMCLLAGFFSSESLGHATNVRPRLTQRKTAQPGT